jgi:hypothetical protein
MTSRLDWNDLRRRLGHPLSRLSTPAATDVVLRLGGLARWFLRPEVLRLAADNDAVPESYRQVWQQLPQLPATFGSCWVVFATDRQLPLELLCPAFVLPLRWVQGQPHSPRLPAGLIRLAADVVEVLAAHGQLESGDWGLALGEELGELDLSEMPLDCDSGWASLAAGLLVAARGGSPNPRIWATGSWDDGDGIRPVEFLSEKLDLAVQRGAQVCFVPQVQREEAQRLSGGGIEIGCLRMAERDPVRTLADLTVRLESPPPPPDGPDDQDAFERCSKYYRNQPRGEPAATRYYWTHLLPTITQRCRAQILAQYENCRPTHMVTIVSGSPELVLLAARSVDVRRCLLLYTPDENPSQDQTGRMRMVRELLEADGRVCVPAPFANSEALEREIPAAVHGFVQGPPPNSLVLDLTPGTKWMTLIADRAMPAGSWRLYVKNDTLSTPDNRPGPGSEQLVCWKGE